MGDHHKKPDPQTVIHIPIRLVLEIEIVTTEPDATEPSSPPPAPPLNEFDGADLRRRREAARLTRAALAELADLAPSTIRNIELRRHKARATVIRRLYSVAALNFRTPKVLTPTNK